VLQILQYRLRWQARGATRQYAKGIIKHSERNDVMRMMFAKSSEGIYFHPESKDRQRSKPNRSAKKNRETMIREKMNADATLCPLFNT
jgi:hypothetical protein